MQALTLDVVIPVYNEGENIVAVLTQFQEQVITPMRVLICYDHEGDTTLKAVRGHLPWRIPSNP